jgi:glycosyltransferase involved in cell wall biosynthesis
VKRLLVAYGDTNNLRTWGGIPYSFLQAGRRTGLFDGGVSLHPERFRRRRVLWNAVRPLTLDRTGGYMYGRDHLQSLWASSDPPEEAEYVSHFQLLPPNDLGDKSVTYYIDATMNQYFSEYDRKLGRRIKSEALARETEAYHAARFVVCMSRWCAEDVKTTYTVDPAKVRVILPGANIDESAIPRPDVWDGSLSPLRLGFIGIDWERKGGPILLEAASHLTRMGHPVEVVVIGPARTDLPDHPALRSAGFVDKREHLELFVSLVRSFHFGCLLSRAEALGISTMECLRLGVPVIGTAVGGIVDTVSADAGLLLPAENTCEHLVEALLGILETPERYAELRSGAARVSSSQSWTRTVDEFTGLLAGSSTSETASGARAS